MIKFALNTEGVFQFEPRVTPWGKSSEIDCNPEGVGQPTLVFAGREGFAGQPLSGLQSISTLYPGCYPGLELENTFGV